MKNIKLPLKSCLQYNERVEVVVGKQNTIIDIRDAFLDTLYDIAKDDRDVIFLTADMGAWSLNRFKKDMPGQFINVGIAEQNMVSVAAGLALGGKKVFIYSIVPFVTERCFEQIKIDICTMELPVTIIGTGPGLTYTSDGPTHHAIEDVSVMRALPGITILNPCDQFAAQASARIAYESEAPVYVRLDKGRLPMLYNKETDFSKGVFQLKEGNHLLIITTGIITHKAFELSEKLKKASIDAGIIDIFRIKPLNKSMLIDAIQKVRAVVTFEEHTLIGGIGSAVSGLFADENVSIPLRRLGIDDKYCELYGSREWMHEYNGIDVSTACQEIVAWCRHLSISDRFEEYPYELSEKEFAEIFGVNKDKLPTECREVVRKTNFRYRIVRGRERENLLFRATKALGEDLSVSGPHREPDWEKGWSENLGNFIKSNYDAGELIPKFVKKKEYVRLDGEYIFPANTEFETAFVTVLRTFLFKKYFAPFKTIYEFGCGTGHNLLALAKLYPDKQLLGLDWTESSCKIVRKISEAYKMKMQAMRFNMFSPDFSLPIDPGCAVLTIGGLEQIGTNFDAFLDFLLKKKIGLCVNVETIYELYDQNLFFDYVAAKYIEKRGYLQGYLTRLKQLEQEKDLQILDVRRTSCGFFHDGYNYIVWKPLQ